MYNSDLMGIILTCKRSNSLTDDLYSVMEEINQDVYEKGSCRNISINEEIKSFEVVKERFGKGILVKLNESEVRCVSDIFTTEQLYFKLKAAERNGGSEKVCSLLEKYGIEYSISSCNEENNEIQGEHYRGYILVKKCEQGEEHIEAYNEETKEFFATYQTEDEAKKEINLGLTEGQEDSNLYYKAGKFSHKPFEVNEENANEETTVYPAINEDVYEFMSDNGNEIARKIKKNSKVDDSEYDEDNCGVFIYLGDGRLIVLTLTPTREAELVLRIFKNVSDRKFSKEVKVKEDVNSILKLIEKEIAN